MRGPAALTALLAVAVMAGCGLLLWGLSAGLPVQRRGGFLTGLAGNGPDNQAAAWPLTTALPVDFGDDAAVAARLLQPGFWGWLWRQVMRWTMDGMAPLAKVPEMSLKLESNVSICTMGSGSNGRCSLSSPIFRDNEWTRVFPGGNTTCLDGSPYAFQAMKGDPNKVLIYFQGGGCCFNNVSTNKWPGVVDAPLCFQEVLFQPLTGVFNRTDPANPFRDYTLLHINYCSGDAHMGNVVRNYTTPKGNLAVQRGYANTMSALDWLRENGFNRQVDDLTLIGMSAGSLAIQVLSGYILDTFPAKRANVMSDAYVGIFPAGKTGPLIRSFGMCSIPIFSDEVRSRCIADQLTPEDMFFETMSNPKYSQVRFSTVTGKADQMQRLFYVAVDTLTSPEGNPVNSALWINSGVSFYKAVIAVLARFSKLPNWSYFLINGEYHGYTCYEGWGSSAALGGPYWTGPTGQKGLAGEQPELRTWAGLGLDSNGRAPASVCTGTSVQWWNFWVTSFSTEYCQSL